MTEEPDYSCKACGTPCEPPTVGDRPLSDPLTPVKACECDGPIIAHITAGPKGFMFLSADGE